MRYLVKARVKPGREEALLKALADGTLGKGSIAGDEYQHDLQQARVGDDRVARWVETCFCATPLAEERPYWEEYFELLDVKDAHHRRNCRHENGTERWACCHCDCTQRLEERLQRTGESFLKSLRKTGGAARTLMLAGALGFGMAAARADCAYTNAGIIPLNELGFRTYSNFVGGLYPGGANTRPPGHEAAGLQIAQQIQPLDATGNVDTNNGKIVLLSLGMSNTTQEWASKGTNHFLRLATNDPSLNSRVRIVDGAIGGQDAVEWTNANAGTWDMVISQRLVAASVTTNQVQVLWLKQALAGPRNYGNFPLHAQALQNQLATILRIARSKYPNLKLAYLSCRTRAYVSTPTALNPEPCAFETAFADKWVIEDQIVGRNNLNFDPARGPVVAPWLSWGPYLWADGTIGRSDGFTWLCSDLESDFTHPSATGGVPKVAHQLMAFFKTDPTATPWFLKKTIAGQPPACAPAANVTKGLGPLVVNFSANASDPDGGIHDRQWTFEDGTFSTNANPTKTFFAPGTYHARLTVTDTAGNTTLTNLTITAAAAALESPALVGGQFQFFVHGVTGANHIVEASVDLAGWTALQTNRGPYTFTNAGSANVSARYYRVVSLP